MSSYPPDLESAISLTQTFWNRLSEDPNFFDIFTQAFGNDIDRAEVEAIVLQLRGGDFSGWPEIKILDENPFQRAIAGYAESTNTIYIYRWQAGFGDPSWAGSIPEVLLEAVGHSIDARLNDTDSPGDEGAIFSALLRGEVLSARRQQQLRTEDSKLTLVLDGQSVLVEQAYIEGRDDDAIDILIGFPGADYLRGYAGNDSIGGGRGNDVLSGDEGNDILAGHQEDDTLLGGDGNDNIHGHEGNDILDGGDGNDYLNGGAGDDTLLGGTGDNDLHGGEGNDIYVISASNRGDFIRDDGGTDTLRFTDVSPVPKLLASGVMGFYRFAEVLIIDFNQNGEPNGEDVWVAHFFADSTTNSPGSGFIETIGDFSGADILKLDFSTYFLGDDKDNALSGKATNDTLIGGAGDDRLNGGAGNDKILGGSEADLIVGGTGTDSLTGGDGADDFQFGDVSPSRSRSSRKMSIDRITDFEAGEDSIVLRRSAFGNVKRSDFKTVRTIAQARNSSAEIVYIQRTGALFYNQNGAAKGFGSGGQFADLTDGLQLTASDFSIAR